MLFLLVTSLVVPESSGLSSLVKDSWESTVKYTKDTFASASLETCAPGGSYFGYSIFPGVMLASSMHSPEMLFPDLHQHLLAVVLNSLTAKSVPAGTKLVLFGRYVINIYVGIVQFILCKTKTWHAKIHLPTQRTNQQKLYDIN